MSDRAKTSYDEVPYESFPYDVSHPDRLATIGTLFGMKPAPVDECRVLELGCASGGNIIPMADCLPRSRFLGIDLSSRQIAQGRQMIEALGLTNIELRHCDILDVGPEFGTFDYIICHGVYSWVPNHVQDRILAVCAEHLTPQGIAYVSYNTYPGWYLRHMIRDMMRYHVRAIGRPDARIQAAKEWLEFLVQAVPTQDNAYGLLLKGELERIAGTQDSYLFHEHLEDVNVPIYFHEFVERAEATGLQYLGESNFCTMVASNFAPEVECTLQNVAEDLIAMEQYMDFVRNRMFRCSLLCRATVALRREVRSETVTSLYVACPARAVSASPDLHTNAVEAFHGLHDINISSRDAIMKAALVELGAAWPGAVAFDKLLTQARARSDASPPQDSAIAGRDGHILASSLLRCYAGNAVELRVWPPPVSVRPGSSPATSRLARFQAAHGPRVTNLRHEMVQLNNLNRCVARLLDGRLDESRLLVAVEQLLIQSAVIAQDPSDPIEQSLNPRQAIPKALRGILSELARTGLLVDQSSVCASVLGLCE